MKTVFINKYFLFCWCSCVCVLFFFEMFSLFVVFVQSQAKHHAVAAMLDRPFTFTGKPFVVQ